MQNELSVITERSLDNYQPDLISLLLADKRSNNTQMAYQKDLNNFFMLMTGHFPTSNSIMQFLSLSQREAAEVVITYKSILIQDNKTENTINRRLAALRSLVKLARRMGHCDFDLKDIDSETVTTYRDTSGVTLEQMKEILAMPNTETFKGKRDYTLLRLLFENALRRNEASSINIEDYEKENKRIGILGKGKGTQKEWVSISDKMIDAIDDYLENRSEYQKKDPLFITTDYRTRGRRLGGEGIRRIVRDYGADAGIKKAISPHKLRHTAITVALDNTNGDIRAVQQFSRHKKVETLMVYDDNRKNKQKDVTTLLSSL